MTRRLLKGGTVVPVDPAFPAQFTGDVLVEGNRIAAVAPRIDVDPAGAEIVDVSGCIVAPGFVDTHRHTWQSLLRHLGADWAIADYGPAVFGRYGPRYTPDDMYVALRLGLAEALDAGITQVFDWNHNLNTPDHADETVRAHRDSGARVVLGYGQSSADWHRTYGTDAAHPPSEDIHRLREGPYAADTGLTTLAMAARGPEKASAEVAAAEWRQARDLGLRISVHVGNGIRAASKPVRQLHDQGLLGPDTTYVHCSSTTDAELALIAGSGGTASCAPAIESAMGHGHPAIGRLMAAGVVPSLSVDTCVTTGGDLFGVMRVALAATRAAANGAMLARGQAVAAVTLRAAEVLSMATHEGARANGTDRISGTLTPGKDADIVVVRAAGAPNLTPLNDAVAALVTAAHPGNVDSVYVAGTAVKRDGRLLGADLPGLYAAAWAARDRILR